MKMKRFSGVCIVLAVLLSVGVYAAPVASIEVVEERAVEVVLRAELTEWVYRTYDGRLQMRLWSITNLKWLTDWIDC